MARSADVIEDRTPLDGPTVDVAARIGWVLRSARLGAGVSVREMPARLESAGVSLSAASLSRLETSGQRDGRIVDGYERVLGLTPGTLRAPIDVFCRHLVGAPTDRSPGPGEPDLARFSRRVEAVLEGEPTGADWLAFAAEHARAAGFGITETAMVTAVRRLGLELARAVGIALITRIEALARLRGGPYAAVVREVVPALDLPARAVALFQVIDAVADRPTPQLLEHWASLLGDASPRTASFASLALEHAVTAGDLDDDAWAGVVPHFVAAAAEAGTGDTPDAPERRFILSQLFRGLPAPTRRAISVARGGPIAQAPGPVDWTRTRRNAHYGYAVELAQRASAEVGLPEQPMLARLLFEVLYDYRINRFGTAWGTIAATRFPAAVTRLLAECATDSPDPGTRRGARNGIVMLAGCAGTCPDLSAWFGSGDTGLERTAHLVHGQLGLPVPDQVLLAAVAGDRTMAGEALHGAGMAGHPLLPMLASDRTRPEWVRGRAAWWLEQGARVVR